MAKLKPAHHEKIPINFIAFLSLNDFPLSEEGVWVWVDDQGRVVNEGGIDLH